MIVSLIVSKAKDNVIGVLKENDQPWYLPADLRRFKELTIGKTIIMGRKTYESIVSHRGGKPLPDRTQIVLTRDPDFTAPGVFVVRTMDEALRTIEDDEAFVIGGASVYAQAMPLADRLYITEVDATVAGDVFFPMIEASEWREVFREQHDKDEKNHYNYSFVTYERKT